MSELPTIEISAPTLAVWYGSTQALSIESLRVQGRIIGLVGHNGSGKSTFLKTALKILTPREGELTILGRNGGESYRLIPELHMAFSPERGSIFQDISVESYIKLWCRLKCNDPKFYQRAGAKYLDCLQIHPLLHRLGRELSKGERRRVQAAVGFLINPRLFLFDEPFEGLDIEQAERVVELLTEEAKLRSFIISSHHMQVIERLADEIIVLSNGRIAAQGSPSLVSRVLADGTTNSTSLLDAMSYHLRNRHHNPPTSGKVLAYASGRN